jgi:hypothetical protein
VAPAARREEPAERRISRALDAWARYVEAHPYAPQVFFHDTTGDPDVQAIHRKVQAQASATLPAILGAEPGAEKIGSADEEDVDMARRADPRRPHRARDLVDRAPHVPASES